MLDSYFNLFGGLAVLSSNNVIKVNVPFVYLICWSIKVAKPYKNNSITVKWSVVSSSPILADDAFCNNAISNSSALFTPTMLVFHSLFYGKLYFILLHFRSTLNSHTLMFFNLIQHLKILYQYHITIKKIIVWTIIHPVQYI